MDKVLSPDMASLVNVPIVGWVQSNKEATKDSSELRLPLGLELFGGQFLPDDAPVWEETR